MASRRVVGIVALCAAAAVAAIVGGTLLLSRHETTSVAGTPLIQLEVDPHSALGRAQKLLDGKHPDPEAAAAIFRRYSTPEAKLGLAFAEWRGPGSLANVKAIVAATPRDPAMVLNLGFAEFQAGLTADAERTWRQTAARFPDSPYAVDALDALNTGVFPGLPPIIVDFRAVAGSAREHLEAGWRAWNLKHVVTARRELAAAARLAPDSAETLVADAVALFSPAQPLAPFPHLGPLTARFPHAAIVRLHLGVLLLWSKQVARGKKQLRLAVSEQPASVYAKQARTILEALGQK